VEGRERTAPIGHLEQEPVASFDVAANTGADKKPLDVPKTRKPWMDIML